MNAPARPRMVGRLLRVVLGVAFLALVAPVWIRATSDERVILAGIALGLFAFYTLLHVVAVRFSLRLNATWGVLLAVGPPALVFVGGEPYGDVATLTFVAVSLVVAGARGDPGCEVGTIPAWLFGGHTHLLCPLFTPIDRLEARFGRQ